MCACIQICCYWNRLAAYRTAVTRSQLRRPALLLYVYFCVNFATYLYFLAPLLACRAYGIGDCCLTGCHQSIARPIVFLRLSQNLILMIYVPMCKKLWY